MPGRIPTILSSNFHRSHICHGVLQDKHAACYETVMTTSLSNAAFFTRTGSISANGRCLTKFVGRIAKVQLFTLGDDTKVDGDDTAPMKNEDEDKRKKLPYMCQTCGMGFRHKSSMEVHEYSHKGRIIPLALGPEHFDHTEIILVHHFWHTYASWVRISPPPNHKCKIDNLS